MNKCPTKQPLRWLLAALLTCIATTSIAQTQATWQEDYQELMREEDDDEEPGEELYEWLASFIAKPIALNRATREDLEQLPFLSDQQIEDILFYRYQCQNIRSTAELHLIPSLSNACARLLSHFVSVEEPSEKPYDSLLKSLHHGYHQMVLSANIPLYQRRGFIEKKYLGGPIRHDFRYTFQANHQIAWGLIGAQDAGEPFFKQGNSCGYDHYAGYLLLRDFHSIKTAIIGHYRVKIGMGLVINNDFALGKTMLRYALERTTATLHPHASRTAGNYLQGTAVTIALNRYITTTNFVSYRANDATLNKDDSATISTLLYNGLHRTEKEILHKNNHQQFVAGTHLQYAKDGFHLAATLLHTTLSRVLRPNTTRLYKQFAPAGKHFTNLSIDYGYTNRHLSFMGETAMDKCCALATLNSLTWQASSSVQMQFIQRFYSLRYQSLFARSFGENGHVQDESGLFSSLQWRINALHQLYFAADYAYFAWPKYRQSFAGTHAIEARAQWDFQGNNWRMNVRYNYRLQQQDVPDHSKLHNKHTHRMRMQTIYPLWQWQCQTELNGVVVAQEKQSPGFLLSQTATKSWNAASITAHIAYFYTQDNQAALYQYERALRYQFHFLRFSGKGMRYALQSKLVCNRHFIFIAHAGLTHYFDRQTIGTGPQQIMHPVQADIQIQTILKF